MQLTAIQLVALIKKDELNVQEEREVYNAVLKWVKYDEEKRYPKMENILLAVRCQYLTPNFLRDQMKNCDVLKKLPQCREYLAQIFKVIVYILFHFYSFLAYSHLNIHNFEINYYLFYLVREGRIGY